MFFTLKYGDDKMALLNLQCQVPVLMDHIRTLCHCRPQVYASELLKEREVLIPVKVERSEGCGTPKYIPLLQHNPIINSEFLAHLPTGECLPAQLHKPRLKKLKRTSQTLSSVTSLRSRSQPTSDPARPSRGQRQEGDRQNE
ncbi:uncharacterized protein [Chiloscyllium punctatum]|uniref:uncharacterized protein isoform X4 n=1 Tax=Chiloscyllium punctatum TaxID=137246 RepID=UPI003B6357A2